MRELTADRTWWKGPPWSSSDEADWSKDLAYYEIEEENTEEEEEILPILQLLERSLLADFTNISTCFKLKRVMVYVLRFLKIRIWNRISEDTKIRLPTLFSIFSKIEDNG